MIDGSGLNRKHHRLGMIPQRILLLAIVCLGTMSARAAVIELKSQQAETPIVMAGWPESIRVPQLPSDFLAWQWSIVDYPGNNSVASGSSSTGTTADGNAEFSLPTNLPSGVFELRLTVQAEAAESSPPWSWQRLLFWNEQPPVPLASPAVAQTWTLIVGDPGPQGHSLIDSDPSSNQTATRSVPSPRQLLVRLLEPQFSAENLAASPAADNSSPGFSIATVHAAEKIQWIDRDVRAARSADALGVVLQSESNDWWLERAIVQANQVGLQVHLELPDSRLGISSHHARHANDGRVNGWIIHRPSHDRPSSDRPSPESDGETKRADDLEGTIHPLLGGKMVVLVGDQRDGDGTGFLHWIQKWRAVEPQCVVLVSRNRPSLTTLSGQFVSARSRSLDKSLSELANGFWLVPTPPETLAVETVDMPRNGQPVQHAQPQAVPATDSKSTVPQSVRRLSLRVLPASWRMGGQDASAEPSTSQISSVDQWRTQAFLHDFCELTHQRTGDPKSIDDWMVVDASMLNDPVSAQAIAIWRNWLSGPISTLAAANPKEATLARAWRASSPDGDFLLLVNHALWPQRLTLLTDSARQWKFLSHETQRGVSAWSTPTPIPTQPQSNISIELAALSWTVIHTDGPIESPLRFRTEIIEPVQTLETLTKQMTHIVERLGLLNEPEPPHGASVDLRPTLKPVSSQPLLQYYNPMILQRSASMSQFEGGGMIRNGNFEQDASTPLEAPSPEVPGWMHAQHPIGAVRLDVADPRFGKQCVRLQAGDQSGTRSWLISPTFMTPTTGRLAVSMTIKASAMVNPTSVPSASPSFPSPATTGAPTSTAATIDPQTSGFPTPGSQSTTSSSTGNQGSGMPAVAGPNSGVSLAGQTPVAQVRVSIEGSYQNRPCRHTATIAVPTDGKWQPNQMVLQWLDVDPLEHTNLRLTIDNLSTHHVWIDEIYVSDWFASRAERAETQSSAYLAVQGLQKSDLTNAAQLLQNFWANQLLQLPSHAPSQSPSESSLLPEPVWGPDVNESPRVIAASTHPPISEAPTTEKRQTEPTAHGNRRWKDWLPQPLRF